MLFLINGTLSLIFLIFLPVIILSLLIFSVFMMLAAFVRDCWRLFIAWSSPLSQVSSPPRPIGLAKIVLVSGCVFIAGQLFSGPLGIESSIVLYYLIGLLLLAVSFGPARWRFPVTGGLGAAAAVRAGIRAYLCFLPGMIILAYLGKVLIPDSGIDNPLYDEFLRNNSGEASIFYPVSFYLLAVIFAPFVEEVYFRGMLFSSLGRYLRLPWALVISSVLFALLHPNWQAFPAVFGLGLVLGGAYSRSGNLLAPLTIHALHNCLVLGCTVLLNPEI